MTAAPLDLLTVGRVGVALYPDVEAHPDTLGAPLERVTAFARFLGGTATNVAVSAARLGRRAAVLTKVGADPFGAYVREALAGFGVDPRYVGTALTLQTALGFLLTIVTIQGLPVAVDVLGWRGAMPLLAIGPIAGVAAMRALGRLERAG